MATVTNASLALKYPNLVKYGSSDKYNGYLVEQGVYEIIDSPDFPGQVRLNYDSGAYKEVVAYPNCPLRDNLGRVVAIPPMVDSGLCGGPNIMLIVGGIVAAIIVVFVLMKVLR